MCLKSNRVSKRESFLKVYMLSLVHTNMHDIGEPENKYIIPDIRITVQHAATDVTKMRMPRCDVALFDFFLN